MKKTLVAQCMIPEMTHVPALRLSNSLDRLGPAPVEQQAVYLMTEGWDDFEFARELDLEESTPKKTRVGICNKIGVCSSVEVLFYIPSRGRQQTSPGETGQDEVPNSSEIVNSYRLRLST